MRIAWFLCGGLSLLVILLLIKLFFLKRDMEEIWIELQDHLSYETNTLLSTSSHDTQVKNIVKELNKAISELRKQRHTYANGHRELKEAVTTISHDLRTPLTAIEGYLDFLDQEEVSPTVARYVKIIRNRVNMMEYLTEELFHYSIINENKQKPMMKKVALNDILEESIAAFYAIFKMHHIEPEIIMPETKVYRWLDPSNLSRIFSNLLHNVVKYSEGDVKIRLTSSGEITFINTSTALHDVEIAHLFHRYYTVDRGQQATGLGLTIAQKLVNDMNGTIMAQSIDQQLIIKITFS